MCRKKLGESIHPIGSTRSMHIMQPSSPGADETTYANAPTVDGVTVPRWYISVVCSLDTRTVPWAGSAYQRACRMRGEALLNFSNSVAASLLVV